MNITELIQQFCVPCILVVCYCIGFAIKKTNLIKDNYIPAIMVVLGGISGFIVNGLSYESIAVGVASGLAATGAHQIIKQLSKDDGYSI